MPKQKVKILSDATIDLPPKLVKELNISILPTQIMIEDREKPYRNYIDITPEEFWDKLLKCRQIPTTSVPRQGDIYEIYETELKKYESLIVIAHSSKISSSYALAKKVADQMFPGKDITVIDSKTITILEGLLAYEAAKMAQKGAGKDEITSRMHELIPHTHGIAILKNLDYLRKGGRISVAKQLIANLANFRPLIGIEDGLVKNIGKVKGFENGVELIKAKTSEILKNRKIDPVIILHAIMPKEANELCECILSQKENAPKLCEAFLLGPALGAHMGPYCVGLGWIGQWDENWFK